ncbi:MAG: Uma2 family endonuclease [Pyrinomonadaceae bacterium]|nr:Uma2 family endonuclease [Pyrinomonadaceae bacterium]
MASVFNPSLKEMAQAAINQKLILQGVGWDFYERVLKEFTHSNALHFAYDDGFLEIEVPLFEHERPTEILRDLITTICIDKEISYINAGSTTFRQRAKSKGCEPDTAFYIQNERRIRGLKHLDLNRDPSPDLVIEVDITSPSLNKMPIYAALGVSEVWLYKGEKVIFLKLYGGVYQETANSPALPFLDSRTAQSFLEKGFTESSLEWNRAIRKWANEID